MGYTELNPKLRFPKFIKDEDSNSFKKYCFEDIFLFSTGKNIKQNEASPAFKTPCVRYGELYHLYNEVIYRVVNRTNLDESELHFSDGNEILLPSAGEDPLDIGSASALTIKNVAIGRTINILKPKIESLYSQIFVSYYINQNLKRTISSLAKGVSISNVYNSDLKKLEIILPSLPEQQKIASFLTSIDKRIKLLEEKKEKLESYKKGVMQKLFSQEIRFKPSSAEAMAGKDEKGNSYPDWEEKNLGEVFKFKQGVQCPVEDQFNSDGEGLVRFVRIIDLTQINEPIRFIQNPGDEHLIKCDEIFMVRYGTPGMLGYGFTGVIANNLFRLISKNRKLIYNKFYYYQLLFRYNEIGRLASSTTMPAINFSTFNLFKVPQPCIDEQQKIANLLTSIDKKIEHTKTQIEKSKEFKKGLLQQMFV